MREHPFQSRTMRVKAGSSPRMRGTRFSGSFFLLFIGIIPAYAGNTPFGFRGGGIVWDHPRVCGEHIDTKDGRMMTTGSSPRMRGTQCLMHFVLHLLGIIPAYAGNTMVATAVACAVWDHPRVCGEHRTNATGADDQKGSSPRMRGTRHPAFATCGPNRDHPRVCGEHFHGAVW